MKAEEALALAKSYTKKSLAGQGALKGEDGKSAYQVAVDNGFDGTEEEWLESLKAGSVEISKVENNALEEREDGLYVGIVGKTYRSLAELGLTAPVKVIDILSVLEMGENVDIEVPYNSNDIIDLPDENSASGILKLTKTSSTNLDIIRFVCQEQIYLGLTSGNNLYWDKIMNKSAMPLVFKDLDSMGVTTPCTTYDVLYALGLGDKAELKVTKEQITDLPVNGVLYASIHEDISNYNIELVAENDDRYIAIKQSDDSYVWEKIATTNDFVKTYKSIEETGVTTPCTLSSLVSAMGATSTLHCSASKSIITDLPIGGSLKIEVSKNNTYFIHLWNTEYYYIANYVGSGQFEWKKMARTDDVLSLAGGYMKNNAFLIFPGSGEGASSKITNTEIMVDDANNNKTTSVTAEGIDTPSLKINGENVSFGVQDVPTKNMNELTTPGIYFKIDGSYMHNAPSKYGTPGDTSGKPDHFAIIEVIEYYSQFMPKPLIIQKYYRINYNEDCGNDCATRHQSNFGWGEWTYEADRDYVDSKQITTDVLVDMHNLNDNSNVTLSKGISNYKLLVFSMYTEHNNSVGNKISAGTNTIPAAAFSVNDQMLFASTYMSDVVCGITAMSLSDTQLSIDNLSDFDSTVLSTYVTIYGIK